MPALLPLLAALQDDGSGLPWMQILALLLLGAICAIAWQLLGRLRAFEERLTSLDRLPEIKTEIARLGDERSVLDLRRLEHVLIDMRDAQKRLDERLMQIVEAARQAKASVEHDSGGERAPRTPYSERIVNRLLAMGYERIQILTPVEELAQVFDEGGEVVVEARQEGAVCKGRVRVREGGIVGAELKSAHSMFP
jgi:hypothetical protein